MSWEILILFFFSEEELDGENPWSGSLRHVKGPGKNKKHEEKDDNHGGAPWMGTLRHVVHDNKVTLYPQW